MALIPLEEAATRYDVPQETLREWVQLGLLPIHRQAVPGASDPAGGSVVESVDEEKLADVVESQGWLQLSAENWDDEEGQ